MPKRYPRTPQLRTRTLPAAPSHRSGFSFISPRDFQESRRRSIKPGPGVVPSVCGAVRKPRSHGSAGQRGVSGAAGCPPGVRAARELTVPPRRDAQKLRFGPWLLNAVSSGLYRGLCWIDPDRRIFRIPWKHNARKDVTSSDVEIFKVGGRRGLRGGWDGQQRGLRGLGGGTRGVWSSRWPDGVQRPLGALVRSLCWRCVRSAWMGQ